MQRGADGQPLREDLGRVASARADPLLPLFAPRLTLRTTLTRPCRVCVCCVCVCLCRLLEEERAISLLQSKLASKNEKYKRTKAALAALQQRLAQQAGGDDKSQPDRD